MASPASPMASEQDAKDAIQKGITAQKGVTAEQLAERKRARTEIDEKRIQSQILRLNNEFGILNYPDADTLTYIGPPPQTWSESQTWDHTYSRNNFSVPHRVHSGKFLDLNSQKFNELFGPRSIRTERRFRKEGILSRVSTEGIKYFVDLRPPTEDEEAVILLTSLTCTKGVLTWHTAENIYGLSPMLVKGQDDSSSIPIDFHLPEDEKASEDHKLKESKKSSTDEKEPWDMEKVNDSDTQSQHDLTEFKKEENDGGMQNTVTASLELPKTQVFVPESPSPGQISPKASTRELTATISQQPEKPLAILPEYSILRHRSAIERLLQAIENGDPKLDSAPKVWTFFAVAKYFDCASHERISGWITKWLLSHPNCNFIQSNPEVALRLGLGTQSESITKDAFSILVGEKSLMNVFGETFPAILSPLVQSVHGRKLELLDDDERNRIDHAAASLVRRIRQKFDELVDGEMAWLQRSSYYKSIFSLVPRNQGELDVINNLIQKVKQFVRGRIIWVLCRSYDDDFSDFDQALKSVRTFYPGTRDTFRETYNNLNERERIFTRFFWIALNREVFADGAINLWTERTSTLGLPRTFSSQLSQKMLDRTMQSGERLCQVVTKKEVDALLIQFNQIGRSQTAAEEQKTRQSMYQTLPVSPGKCETHLRPGKLANATKSEIPSAWAYDGSNSLYNTSPKREQTVTPPVLLKEKRRKLGDADVGFGEVMARPSAFQTLTIRSRGANFSGRDGEVLQSSDDLIHNNYSEMQVNPTELVQSCNTTTQPEAGRENIVPRLSGYFASPIGDVEAQSGTYNFGHGESRTQSFQPDLPNFPRNGLSMKEATYRQHITDAARKATLWPLDNDDNRAPVKLSDGYGANADKSSQDRQITGADYSYDTDEDKSGRVVTAADWSLQADDVDWTEPRVKQQFSDYPSTQSRNSQPGYLLYTKLFHDISNILHRICDEIVNPTHLFHGDNVLPTSLIDTLMCLNEDEWKYLPLWAGGNDDGTGGVFDEVDVPNLEAGGFKGGKRGIGSARTSGASSSISESSFDDIGGDAVSTVGKASKAATDGTQTVKSLSDMESEEEGFMRQNELWDEIRDMKLDEARPIRHGNEQGVDKGKARAEDPYDGIDDGMDEQDADEVDTIVGAGSTDSDDDTMDAEDDLGFSGVNDERDDDDDMEIINAADL